MRKNHGYESKKSLYGFMFILPWIIGFSLFFLMPFVQSVVFSFSEVSITQNGFKTEFTGIENYRFIFFESAKYVDNLVSSFTGFIYKVPIIFVLSFIIAVVLNGDFRGRAFFRSLFFIPVIVSTGVVMKYIGADSMMESMRSAGGSSSAYVGELIDFTKVFAGLGLPTSVTEIITKYLNDIFNLVWNCGIPIVLFISGLQSISAQLYEVSRVEGATKWEELWYITVPMLRHSMILVAVFTTIDFCASSENKAMKQAFTLLLEQQNYNESSAMMWAFFMLIGIVFALILFLVQHFIFRRWE